MLSCLFNTKLEVPALRQEKELKDTQIEKEVLLSQFSDLELISVYVASHGEHARGEGITKSLRNINNRWII